MPLDDNTSYTKVLTDQVQAALYNHFKDHGPETITPVEWNEAVVALVIQLQGETPTVSLLKEKAQLEAQLEDKELFYQDEVRKAQALGKRQGVSEAVTSLQSFCNSEPRLGPDDKKDVPGVRRAVTILSKELLP